MKYTGLQTIIREPLLHFLLIGAAIFFVYDRVGDPVEINNRIVISQSDLDILAADWIRRTGRPPSPQQIEQQLEQFIREQVLSREAINMGLDQGDVIIRRRLTQKMQYLFGDLIQTPEPGEGDLSAFLSENAERFTQSATLSFTQVFFDPDSRGETIQDQAQQLLKRLQESKDEVDTSELGDPTLLPYQLDNETRQQIGKQFGDEFAAQIYSLPINRWSGPVASAYGLHLVYVNSRTQDRVPPLTEVRESVIGQWRSAKLKQLKDLFYQGIRQRYEIILAEDISEDTVANIGR